MNFKRFSTSDNQWHDIPYYAHKTATDTLTLPAVIYPNDTSITVGIYGNTIQNGTPTPQNPVDVNGCGERTGNLFDENYPSISPTIQYTPMFVGDGAFTLSTTTPQMSNGAACLFLIAGNVSSGDGPQNKVYNEQSVTVDSSNGYITIAYRMVSDYDPRNYEAMLNTGSTALPHEPYGYKIPISCGGTTTPVYLGEVETVRQIKKLVLDGTENWYISAAWKKTNTSVFYFTVNNMGGKSDNESYILSTHLPSKSRNELYSNDVEGIGKTGSNAVTIRISDTIATTVPELKTWLSQNNVSIWYVLSTATTGIVNEPLMKIGDYTDSLTTSVSCTAGENTLDVQTTVAPSEVTAGFSGWHPVQSVHERENGQWD